jgi:hypothetical protein
MATLSTTQEIKNIIATREQEIKPPYVIYQEQYTWELDPTTLVPVGVSVQRTI